MTRVRIRTHYKRSGSIAAIDCECCSGKWKEMDQ